MNQSKLLFYFRLAIQIVFFVLLPGLYINAFAGIKAIYTGLLQGGFNLGSSWPQLIEAIAIIPATILFGRFFCGWMCAFGTLGDFIYLFSSKVFRVRFKMNEKVDDILKYSKYVVLSILVIAVWSAGSKVFSGWSPWDVFGMLVTIGKMPDIGFVLSDYLPGFIIFLFIVIGSAFIERFFCRYLCPLGAVFAVGSKLRIFKVKKPTANCGNCKACTNHCIMGIPLYKKDVVSSGECIHCYECVTICPKGNAKTNVVKEDLRPMIAGAAAVSVITGMYLAGNITASKMNGFSYGSTMNISPEETNKLYNDGTYEGSGEGFRGAITTLNVSVQKDKITDIQIVTYGDDAPWFERAFPYVSNEIISGQTTDVNAVSGATFSSLGIMNAVADALNKAKINDNSQNNTNNTNSSALNNTNSQNEENSQATQENLINQIEDQNNSVQNEETNVVEATKEPDKNSSTEKLVEATAKPMINHSAAATAIPVKIQKPTENKTATTTSSNSNSINLSKPSTAKPSETTAPTTDSNKASQENGKSTPVSSPIATSTPKITAEPTPKSTMKAVSTPKASTSLKDGTYQGSGVGFRRGVTTVSVTVKNEKITDIQIVSYGDDAPWFERAYPVIINEIVSEQSTEVNAVSGATYSSMGIMNAVADALEKAKEG